MDVKAISINDFNYELPDERIAKFPLAERDSSKLLLYSHGNVSHDVFRSLPNHLPSHALMIFNNTKVIRARLRFRKSTGALIEVFLLEPYLPADYEQMFQTRKNCEWLCMIGNLKKWKDEPLIETIEINGKKLTVSATKGESLGTSVRVTFSWHYSVEDTDEGVDFASLIEAMGELPIPPYLNRETQESDLTTYQTVYSKIKGSVAAPTAGLHFTERVLKEIDNRGIERDEVTLHVGAGTFKPVKCDHIEGHDMHTEHFAVRRQTLERLIQHDASAIAVGTTSVRTLESLYYLGLKIINKEIESEQDLFVDQWEPYSQSGTIELPSALQSLQAIVDFMSDRELTTLHAATRIMIVPSYKFKIVKMLITNFHQPKSTLLLLISAFVGDDWRKIYDYALKNGFRFLSYGDSSLLIPKEK